MSESDKQLPPWVVSARQDVEKAKSHWETVHQEGQADIRRGLEVVRIARIRLQELNYTERTLNQDLPAYVWNDEIAGATGPMLAGTASYHEQTSSQIAGLYTRFGQSKADQHEQLIRAASNTGVSSGSLTYMSAGIEQRFQVIVPNYKPILEVVKPEQIGSRQQIYGELAELLRSFEPKYLHMLAGSEDALRLQSIDHLSQAAHSMRDLFQQLMEELAPVDVVKKQTWFESTAGAPGGVSRLSRLKYILYGAGETLDEAEIKQLDDAADHAKVALDLAIARAHDHDPELTLPEVELAIDYARFALLQVLKRYRARYNQVSS